MNTDNIELSDVKKICLVILIGLLLPILALPIILYFWGGFLIMIGKMIFGEYPDNKFLSKIFSLTKF